MVESGDTRGETPMTTLTPEQRLAVEQAGESPVRLEDPETHAAYVLMKAEIYERFKPLVETKAEPESNSLIDAEIPEGIRRSQDAFFRDLPELLKDKRLRGRWIGYHGDERIGIAKRDEPLIRECLRRGLKREEYDLFIIEPHSREPEQVDYPSSWYDV
jgi:hypothetical protein